jgi:membrane protein
VGSDPAPPDPAEGTGSTLGARVRRAKGAVDHRFRGSSAEHIWNRLNAMDFINRGMLFAGMLLLCFFPFMIVVNALTGRGTVDGLVRHLGLNKQAATDLSHVFASTSATSSQVTGASYVFFVLGGVAAATAVQGLYENAYEVESRGMKDFLRQLAWLATLMGITFLAGWVGPSLRHSGGPVLLGVLAFVATSLFWWFTMWFLLAGRVHWRELIAGAVATGAFWVAMQAVFSLIFSNEIISDDKKYGPVGVVFALMSWFIAIGVVIILGAVVGIVWRERQLSLRAGLTRMFAPRSRPAAPTEPGDHDQPGPSVETEAPV